MRLLLIGLMFSAAPGLALACTPAPPPELSSAEALTNAKALADWAASPILASTVREATDISVVHIATVVPGPIEDIPGYYRRGVEWYRREGRLPVRYHLKTDRVLKGAPPTEFIFRVATSLSPGDGDRVWTAQVKDDIGDFGPVRDEQRFWHTGQLERGEGSGWGDCSIQITLDDSRTYLVVRDAEGIVTAAEPLVADDPLPDMIAAMVADPALEYPWRPTVQRYLHLKGDVLRVRIEDCQKETAKVVEFVRPQPDSRRAEIGEELSLYGLAPPFLVAGCAKGDEYLLTGWPFSARLHVILKGQVTFEDRWMQLRFTGEKTIPLETVRTIVRQ